MRRLAVLLLPCALLLSFGTANAKPARLDLKSALKTMSGSITIPPEWGGIWEVSDTTYDCSLQLTDVATSTDTICGGQVVTSIGELLNFTCTGTANGNAMDVTCSGGTDIIPDCHLTMTFEIHATRDGESFHSVSKTTRTYSGTGLGCDFFPDECEIDATSGHRTGPQPVAFCATPTKRTSWGQLKILYR